MLCDSEVSTVIMLCMLRCCGATDVNGVDVSVRYIYISPWGNSELTWQDVSFAVIDVNGVNVAVCYIYISPWGIRS